ncbi:MAG: hypothetical protein JXX14_09305 [Deltaproteobacteria bacterium]|nr:hypothetical protein [Deltaproteobacteria bacterium]
MNCVSKYLFQHPGLLAAIFIGLLTGCTKTASDDPWELDSGGINEWLFATGDVQLAPTWHGEDRQILLSGNGVATASMEAYRADPKIRITARKDRSVTLTAVMEIMVSGVTATALDEAQFEARGWTPLTSQDQSPCPDWWWDYEFDAESGAPMPNTLLLQRRIPFQFTDNDVAEISTDQWHNPIFYLENQTTGDKPEFEMILTFLKEGPGDIQIERIQIY